VGPVVVVDEVGCPSLLSDVLVAPSDVVGPEALGVEPQAAKSIARAKATETDRAAPKPRDRRPVAAAGLLRIAAV
jgi:hypothetical protein